MNNKNAPFSVAALNGAGKTGFCIDPPIANPITFHQKKQGVFSVLNVGVENAIDALSLVRILGFKDRRELSRQIELERRDGYPICASVSGEHRGYYLAANETELRQYITSLDRRIRSVRRTRNACSETLRMMSGQEELEGW